ncbi:MAG TPA: hypothetical protein VMD91_13630 [Candidatus Sulfotelmatobacter sp.]|nr:hypothetical protein [Candidatus Sulfotelmatobacter sp.]
MQGAAGIAGYALAAWFTLFPANDARERQHDFQLVLAFCVVAVLFFAAYSVCEHLYEQYRDDELKRFMLDLYTRPAPAPQGAARGPVPAPAVARLDLGNYADAVRAADASGSRTYAAEFMDQDKTPESLRDELVQLSNNIDDLLRTYHGNLSADSFVSPEIMQSVYPRTREARKSIQHFLPQFNFAKRSDLPVTVSRMAKLTEELKRAAAELPNDIPFRPAPAPN